MSPVSFTLGLTALILVMRFSNLKNKLSCSGHIAVDVCSVVKSFQHRKVGKSLGPDDVSGGLLPVQKG